MQSVRSASIDAVGYDAGARQLHVRYRDSGETYVYYGVEPSEFEALMRAESLGRYVNELIKKRHIARKLGR